MKAVGNFILGIVVIGGGFWLGLAMCSLLTS
jgi:hypothetical protein